jgi:hypothetical protein
MMPEQAYQQRTANQQDFLQLSKQSRLIRASRSGHFPQLSEPEIVKQAVLDCLAMAEKKSVIVVTNDCQNRLTPKCKRAPYECPLCIARLN